MVSFEPQSRPINADDNFWGRYSMQEGLSIVRQNGVLGYLPAPASEELEGLVAGVDYFLGGRIYDVSAEIYAELQALGFAPSLTHYPFGQGPFGQGTFGGSI